jgi:hypothetical protein
LGGIFLATILTLAPQQLKNLLQTFGVHGQTLAITISCFNLFSDFNYYVQKVHIARCARGLMPNRRLMTRVWELLYTVRTLFIFSLTCSLERAKMWKSNDLISRLENLSTNACGSKECSRLASFLLLALSIAWVTVATIYFFKPE